MNQDRSMMKFEVCPPDLCGPELIVKKEIDRIGLAVESGLFLPKETTVKYLGLLVPRKIGTAVLPVSDGDTRQNESTLFSEDADVVFYMRIQSKSFKPKDKDYSNARIYTRLITMYLVYLAVKERMVPTSVKENEIYPTDVCVAEMFYNALTGSLPAPSMLVSADIDAISVFNREASGIENPYTFEHALGSLTFELNL